MDHLSGLVFRRPQATLTADLWSIFAPPFSGSSGLPTPAQPRTRPIRLRLTALLVLGVFATVSIATTVFSLGAYCLTTYSGNPFAGSLP